jgi:hypothetical protein
MNTKSDFNTYWFASYVSRMYSDSWLMLIRVSDVMYWVPLQTHTLFKKRELGRKIIDIIYIVYYYIIWYDEDLLKFWWSRKRKTYSDILSSLPCSSEIDSKVLVLLSWAAGPTALQTPPKAETEAFQFPRARSLQGRARAWRTPPPSPSPPLVAFPFRSNLLWRDPLPASPRPPLPPRKLVVAE